MKVSNNKKIKNRRFFPNPLPSVLLSSVLPFLGSKILYGPAGDYSTASFYTLDQHP